VLLAELPRQENAHRIVQKALQGVWDCPRQSHPDQTAYERCEGLLAAV